MKECLRCGGSAYRDYAYGCDHQFWDDVIPEPAFWQTYAGPADEMIWAAQGTQPCNPYVEHPTREGARQLWREQYAIGLMVDSLFRKLTGWAKEGAELRAKREWVPSNKTALAGAIGEWMHANGKAVRKPREDAFDLRKLEVYPENSTGGDHLEQVREAIEFTRKPYAVWRAEQGLDIVHDHAMSGTPKVPASWPDNRTPEEKAAPPLLHVLSGRRWKIGSDVWVFGEITEGGDIWGAVADGCRHRWSAGYIADLVRVYGSAEVTSE